MTSIHPHPHPCPRLTCLLMEAICWDGASVRRVSSANGCTGGGGAVTRAETVAIVAQGGQPCVTLVFLWPNSKTVIVNLLILSGDVKCCAAHNPDRDEQHLPP